MAEQQDNDKVSGIDSEGSDQSTLAKRLGENGRILVVAFPALLLGRLALDEPLSEMLWRARGSAVPDFAHELPWRKRLETPELATAWGVPLATWRAAEAQSIAQPNPWIVKDGTLGNLARLRNDGNCVVLGGDAACVDTGGLLMGLRGVADAWALSFEIGARWHEAAYWDRLVLAHKVPPSRHLVLTRTEHDGDVPPDWPQTSWSTFIAAA